MKTGWAWLITQLRESSKWLAYALQALLLEIEAMLMWNLQLLKAGLVWLLALLRRGLLASFQLLTFKRVIITTPHFLVTDDAALR